MRRKLISTAAMAVTASLILSSCLKKAPEEKKETVVSVNVEKAGKKELVLSETYVGKASAQEEITVYPSASGEVVELDVSLGDQVTEGQRLFKLDDESARLSLKSAQASKESAQANANAQLGGQQELKEQQEQQQIASAERSADSAERAALEAEHNTDRSERKLEDAEQDRDKAKKDYDKALNKYHKAKSYFEDLKDICEDDSSFAGISSLSEAATKANNIITSANNASASAKSSDTITYTESESDNTVGGVTTHSTNNTTTTTTTVKAGTETNQVSLYSLGAARDIMDLVEDVSDEKDISAADVSSSGVNALKTAADNARTAVINERRSVSQAKDNLVDSRRSEKTADDQAVNAEAGLDDTIANQQLSDGRVLEDTRRSLQANIASSAVGVEQAQYQLSQYVTNSPINGVVESLDIHTHDTVGPSTAALVISNKDSMKIEFSVPENVRDNLSVGQSVKIKNNGKKLKGHITEIGSKLDSGSGLFKITSVVSGDDSLLSGSSVMVKVAGYRDDSGIVVPYDAVYYSGGKPFVYIVENGVAVRKDVTTGMFDDKHIVIIDGIKEGDTVITSWASDLRDGVKVDTDGREKDSSNAEEGKAGE